MTNSKSVQEVRHEEAAPFIGDFVDPRRASNVPPEVYLHLNQCVGPCRDRVIKAQHSYNIASSN